jgi:hypothetical protein
MVTNKLLVGIVIFFIKLYQVLLSPILGKNCRFTPTCSQYAIETLKSEGFFKGMYLSAKRILKCHPFHPGGVDKPPKKGM